MIRLVLSKLILVALNINGLNISFGFSLFLGNNDMLLNW